MTFNTDYSRYVPYFYPVAVVVILLVYYYIRLIILKIVFLFDSNGFDKDNVADHSAHAKDTITQPQMQARIPGATKATVLRTAASTKKLNAKEKLQIYRMSKTLFNQGKIIESAQLLESVDLADKALALLVRHDFIEAAALMLQRDHRDEEAAELLENKLRFKEAVELYTSLENWPKVAICFEKLAQEDHSYLRDAGEAYMKASRVDDAIRVKARLGEADEVYSLCSKHSRWRFLSNYLSFPRYAAQILPQLSVPQLDDLLKSMDPAPHSALLMAQWTHYRADAAMVRTLLLALQKQPNICSLFWKALDLGALDVMIQGIKAQAGQLDSALLKAHASALLAAGYAELAHKILHSESNSAPPPIPVLKIHL